jgi:hypothetical protein
LSAILLTVVLGFAAIGIDLSYVRLARFEMKNATDAAAHAAMFVLRKTKDTTAARKAAQTIAGKNTVLGHAVSLADTDVTFGQWDWDTSTFTTSTPANAVQIYAHTADPSWADGTVNTTFGRVVGHNAWDFAGIAAANIAQTGNGAFRPRSLMFEMDVTGSFLTASCAIDDAIAADLSFLDDLYSAGNVKDEIGLDVFVGDASAFTPLQNLLMNYGSIRSDWYGDGLSALSTAHTSGLGVCQQTGVRVTGNYSCATKPAVWPNQADLKAGFPMPFCWTADSNYKPPTSTVQVWGGTNIGAGIQSGIAALTASKKTYDVRSIVVFTDGGPLCCESQAGGQLCPHAPTCCADVATGGCTDNGTGACACSQAVYDFGIAQADAADKLGIDVYVLEFGGYAPWINYAKLLPRGRGFEIDTSDKTQLAAKLQQIADAIPVSVVR